MKKYEIKEIRKGFVRCGKCKRGRMNYVPSRKLVHCGFCGFEPKD